MCMGGGEIPLAPRQESAGSGRHAVTEVMRGASHIAPRRDAFEGSEVKRLFSCIKLGWSCGLCVEQVAFVSAALATITIHTATALS